MGLSASARRALFAVLAVATAALVFLSPEDVRLGSVVRLLYFHGALTWVNLVTFTAAGITGIVYLLRRTTRAFEWASGFRYLSFGLWIVNTLLGIESMWLVWGGVLWTEPRLRMTFFILLASLFVVAVDLAAGRQRLTSGLDATLAVLVWALLTTTPNLFHPENPVLNSSATVMAFFFGMTATMLAMAVLVAWTLGPRAAGWSSHDVPISSRARVGR